MEARRASVREKKKPDYFGATSSNALTDRPHKATSVDNLTTQESGTASLLTERTREEYNRSFVMGGIERSPPQKKTMEVNPKDNANSLEIPPYSNSTVNPNANETSEGQGAPFQTKPSQPLAPMLHGTDTNNVNGVVTPMDTAPAPVVQPPVVLPATRNVESEEARNARMRIERERKVQELKDNRQRFIIHGTDDESEVDHHDDTGGAVDNSIITGKMLNLMDLQQKHQYANAFHINRIESNQNQFILRITGHDIQDTSDLTTVHSWWEWLMIELGAPSNIRHLDSSLIHFSTNVIENKGRNEGPQGTRKVLILEFPNKEVPKWVLNHGVMNCRKVQRIRGLERLSFSPMLTTADLKVQQYAQGVFNRLKMNFNGPPATRKPFLANIASIRPIGRIKQHISTVDNAGFKKNIHYNKFITDELTREFLPLEGGEIALPPPDYTYQPNDHSLLEIDFQAEARAMGVAIHGRTEGINMKVPNYIQPSVRKMLNEEDKERDNAGRGQYASGVNAEALGVKRFKQDRYYNNPAAASGSGYNNGRLNNGRSNYDNQGNGNSNEKMRVGWNSSGGNIGSRGNHAPSHPSSTTVRSMRRDDVEVKPRRDRSGSDRRSNRDKEVNKRSKKKSSRHSSKGHEEHEDTNSSRRGSIASSYSGSRRTSVDRAKIHGDKEGLDRFSSKVKKSKDKKKKSHRKRSSKKKHRGRHHSSSSDDTSSDSTSDSSTD